MATHFALASPSRARFAVLRARIPGTAWHVGAALIRNGRCWTAPSRASWCCRSCGLCRRCRSRTHLDRSWKGKSKAREIEECYRLAAHIIDASPGHDRVICLGTWTRRATRYSTGAAYGWHWRCWTLLILSNFAWSGISCYDRG